MKKLIALALALVMALSLAACGSKASTTDTTAKKKLVMGTSADYAPFEFIYLDNAGAKQYAGIDISVANAIADDMGMELQVENMAFDNLIGSLQKGDFDMVIAAIEYDEDRAKSADFSDPYYTDKPPVVIVKADKASEYTTVESLNKPEISVGAQTGTTKLNKAHDTLDKANIVALQNVQDLVNQLVNNKLDAIVLDGAVGQGFVEANTALAVSSLDLGASEPYRVLVAKGDPKGLLPGINAAIGKITQGDTISGYEDLAASLSGKQVQN
ncbi:MAG: transporter substrate-binding domain-containing protein [Oscillibacter sp.]|nr:transporter substrate-binding domain-containing protein [Oscillibacter sp.]